jgi:hypothetical protein
VKQALRIRRSTAGLAIKKQPKGASRNDLTYLTNLIFSSFGMGNIRVNVLLTLKPFNGFNAILAEIITADIFYRFNPFVIFVVNQNMPPHPIMDAYRNHNGVLPRIVCKVMDWAGRFTFFNRKSSDIVFVVTDKSLVWIQAGEMKSN